MEKRIQEIIKDIHDRPEVNTNPTYYVYILDRIKEKIDVIQNNAPENVKLYYAMKANPHPGILEYIKRFDYVKGIEIASSGELEKSLQLYPAVNVIFTGPGKTPKELELSLKAGIKLINCESVVEAIRISKLAEKLGIEKVNVLLRINIDYYVDGADEYMAGTSTKMGIDQSQFLEAYDYISRLSNINVQGVHVFSASGILDYKYLIKYAEYVFKLVQYLDKIGIKKNIIDFGGGIGIDYTGEDKQFDMNSYFKELKYLIKDFSFQSKDIFMELGKYLVGDCGYYATRIIDIKNIKGSKHIVTAGGVNHMRLPIATDRKHPIHIIQMNEEKLFPGQPEVINEIVDIEGPLCMNEDKISWNEYIERANIGDVVVLRQSGAYCYSASTLWFLSHELPKEFLVEGECVYEHEAISKCLIR